MRRTDKVHDIALSTEKNPTPERIKAIRKAQKKRIKQLIKHRR